MNNYYALEEVTGPPEEPSPSTTTTSQMAGWQRRRGTTLREHTEDVRHLIAMAYPDIGKRSRRQIELTKFQNTLADILLQRYLLAVEPASLEH